jgi:hypothetical protein
MVRWADRPDVPLALVPVASAGSVLAGAAPEDPAALALAGPAPAEPVAAGPATADRHEVVRTAPAVAVRGPAASGVRLGDLRVRMPWPRIVPMIAAR